MIGGLLLGAVLLFWQSGAPVERAQFFGDYRTVQALAFSDKGELLAATKGGLVAFGTDLKGKSFGWNGLIGGRGPDDVWTRDGKLFVSAGKSVASWDGARMKPDLGQAARPQQFVSFVNSSFVVPERPVWPSEISGPFAPPTGSLGTHVSAVAGDDKSLVAAWYDDGLWERDGADWRRVEGPKNEKFPHVRCLARRGDELALATLGGDVWWRSSGKWRHLQMPNGPHGSVYSLASFKGMIVAGTFENGLAAFDGHSWSPLGGPDHPRDMAVFQGCLFVRRSTGQVDRFDGKGWIKDVFPWLPRTEATSIVVGDGKIMVGQYGGWSEYDGKKWSHFLKLPELESYVVTALAARDGQVWVGTQERGGLLFDRKTRKLTAFDQRQGLGDDWVRGILLDRQGVAFSLFRTGAFQLRDQRFERLTPEVANEATGLARNPATGTLFVGSREGLWRIEAAGAHRVPIEGIESLEIQATLATAAGIWLGTPNGAAFVPWKLCEP